MPFNIKPARRLILVMVAIVLLGVIISKIYYSRVNQSFDPRIIPARELYAGYDALAQQNQFTEVFQLLDSAEAIYRAIPHYSNSYELGVLDNNRAAAYLTLAIYKDSLAIPTGSSDWKMMSKDQLLNFAETAVASSIQVYERWLTDFSDLTDEGITQSINNDFLSRLEEYSDDEQSGFLNRRVKEIGEAQLETPRRLSVSYTNLGIIHRHREDYENAMLCYKKAIELWEENLAAENNLNLLLGKPLKKRTFIQKMFPKERIN